MTPPVGLPTASVIVPCRNEAGRIVPCLDSILATTYPHDRLEVVVVDGASDDGTREELAAYVRRQPLVRVLDNPDRTAPAALNRGIRATQGAVVLRMDAHVEYPPEYIGTLVAALLESGADNVGGLVQTFPADDGPVARAIALALAHPLGVGNSYFRIGSGERRWVDTVAFGCWRREVFDRVGLFDEELVRNQDDEFNFRLRRRGGRILLVPEVAARYYARRSLRDVARMFYQYGYFKPLVALKVGRIMTVRQLVPPLFVAALGAATLLAPLLAPARVALAAIALPYVALVGGAAVRAGRRYGARCVVALTATFPLLHLSYGAGFLAGLLSRLRQPGPQGRAARAVSLTR